MRFDKKFHRRIEKRRQSDLVEQIERLGLDFRGKRTAICVGSRGIAGQASILAGLASYLRTKGAVLEVVSAMGGHGGGEPDSQLAILRENGVLDAVGAVPVSAGLSTAFVGYSSHNARCYVAEQLLDADHVLVVNRIKAACSVFRPYRKRCRKDARGRGWWKGGRPSAP